MTEQHHEAPLTEIQSAAERLTNAGANERPRAFEELAQAVLDHFHHSSESTATSELFSKELPDRIQRFVAGWVVWILAKSPGALSFGRTEGLAGSLFDRVFENNVYAAIGVDRRALTFEKLHTLTAHFEDIVGEMDSLIRTTTDLDQLHHLQQGLMRVFGNKSYVPILAQLCPRSLIQKPRLNSLFRSIRDYVDSTDIDPIHNRDRAFDACDDFANEARSFGTVAANRILETLALQLKTAVATHFDSQEASKSPRLKCAPITKKYPLERPETVICVKIRITNEGAGPARDLRLDDIMSDACLAVETASIEIGTIQSGNSHVFDILARVVAPSTQASLLIQLSWSRLGGRAQEEREFTVAAQRGDVDWDTVEFTEPYSLEAVEPGDHLIGRRDELKHLVKLTNLQTVGSGFIYGQKRVGKTSLANAVEEHLTSSPTTKWIVISKGSGDYVSGDATNTLRNLGEVLAQAMRDRIPGLARLPHPDFTNGLAPLSALVDQALSDKDLRLLFILDEFDELPPELFKRSDLSTSLFQPLRQISSKRGCGFLLVGGENMQKIVNLQGDRLNKFKSVEVDCFDKSTNWSDFADLIRKPVEDWLAISDAALDELFESSAGNPYFAKLLASALFTYMVENRYSHASEIDVSIAIDNALTTIGSNSFAHFWTDGLVDSSNDTEQRRIIRCLVLISVGRAFRRHPSTDAETVWAEFEAAGHEVGKQTFRATLEDFFRRKIFVEDEQGNITPKVPLFGAWLKDKGVRELTADYVELDHLKSRLEDEERIRVKDTEILGLCEEWKHFRFRGRAIEQIMVRVWLGQFDSLDDQRLMFRLLSKVRLYDDHTVRTKMREAFGIVTRNMRTVIQSRARGRRDIFVSSLDRSAAKSGLNQCRLFASENQIFAENVLPLEALKQRITDNHNIQRLVLIDDFSGSGQTLIDGLKKNLDLLLQANKLGINIILITLVGFDQARVKIENFIHKSGLEGDVYFCDELGSEIKAFSEESTVFADPHERDRARQVAETKGVMLERKHPLGYADTQALVVFSQSCPNNTLPILWSRNSAWSPIFPRK